MFSLLVVSLALSTAASATAQAPSAPTNPLVVPSPPLVLVQPNGPMLIEGELVRPFDDMEIHPDPDMCYRIRFFQFSKGQNPKFLRETTCGSKVPTAGKMPSSRPGLVPLEPRNKPPMQREHDVPLQ